MLVAIHALHPVNVMRAGTIRIGGVHLSNVQSAMRHFRVATCAGRCRTLIVPGMAGYATQSFMHTHRSAVVTGADLWSPGMKCGLGASFRFARSVTLIADALSLIQADPDCAILIVQTRNRQRSGSKVNPLSAIKKSRRIRRNFSCRRDSLFGPGRQLPFAMDPMARLARHNRFIRQFSTHQSPRSLHTHWFEPGRELRR